MLLYHHLFVVFHTNICTIHLKKILVILDFFENNNNWDFLSFQNCCPMLKFKIHTYVFLPQEFTIFMFFLNKILFYFTIKILAILRYWELRYLGQYSPQQSGLPPAAQLPLLESPRQFSQCIGLCWKKKFERQQIEEKTIQVIIIIFISLDGSFLC